MKKSIKFLFAGAILTFGVFISCDQTNSTNEKSASFLSGPTYAIHTVTVDEVPDTANVLSADTNNFVPVVFFRSGDLNTMKQNVPDSDYVGMCIVPGDDGRNHVVITIYKPDGSKVISMSCFAVSSISMINKNIGKPVFKYAGSKLNDSSNLCCPWTPSCPKPPPPQGTVKVYVVSKK